MRISQGLSKRASPGRSGEPAILFNVGGFTFAIAASAVEEIRDLAGLRDFSFGRSHHKLEKVKHVFERQGRDYEVSPGEGTFYGPKIDFHITDALGRSWQCGTCQLDFFMPERFDLRYRGEDNAEHRPVMIHRALLGSMERFTGILIEHYGGRFPVWLAPVQTVILPVADRHNDYAGSVRERLGAAGLLPPSR